MTRIAMVESNMSGTGFQAIRIARQMGLTLVFITRDVNLYTAVPGAAELFRRHIDELVTCETNDVETLVATLSAIHHRSPLGGMMTFGEYHIAVTSLACRRLGLPGPDPDAVRTARNKDRMRATCQAAGVPAPRYATVIDPAEAVQAASRIGYPCVVKPADESGSIDVAVCFDEDDVRLRASLIKASPLNYRIQRRSPLMLVEEYLVGPEVSVETVTHAGRTTVVGVTDKQIAGAPFFVEMGHAFPSALSQQVVSACARTAVDALAAIGYDLGIAHVEVKMTAQGPRLIEINPRPAGDRIPDLVELSTGVSLTREAIRMCLGHAPQLAWQHLGAAAIRFLACQPGTVRRLLGVDLAHGVPGVVDVELEVTPGRVVRRLADAHDRVAYVIARGATTYEACNAAETAISQILVDTAEAPANEPAATGVV